MRLDPRTTMAGWLVLGVLLTSCGGGGGDSPPPVASPPPAPPPPLISPQTFAATEDTDFSGSILTRAGSGASLSVVSPPTRGALTAFAANGSFTYRPAANLNGADSFTVEATDSGNNRVSTTITLDVAAVNDAPVAAGEVFEMAESVNLTMAVLGNDGDVDDASLVVVVPPAGAGEEPNPSVGTAVVDADNLIQITLPAGFRGVTRVRYRVQDPANAQSEPVTAAAFVGTPRFDVWYQAPWGTKSQTLLVTDLISIREVADFPAPREQMGTWLSADQNLAVIAEGEGDAIRDLWAVGTSGIQSPVRVTPGYAGTQRIEQVSVSPDGEWLAYVLGEEAGQQLWLVPVADPSARAQVTLPADTTSLADMSLRFGPDSSGVYCIAANANGSRYLFNAAVASPSDVTILYPQPGESGDVYGFYPSPDSSYVVARYDNLYRVPLADPAARTVVNAPLPPGHLMNSQLGDETATRFVYQTTALGLYEEWPDDRLWMTDIANPGVSTLVVDADPQRTGPFGLLSFRPDRDAMLINTWTRLAEEWQLDLVELSLAAGAMGQTVLSRPPPPGSRTNNQGRYLNDGSVVMTELESGQPWSAFEVHPSEPSSPIALGYPGIRSTALQSSRDEAVLAFTHSSNTSIDPGHFGVLVNRAAPGVMLRVTSPGTSLNSVTVLGLVERP